MDDKDVVEVFLKNLQIKKNISGHCLDLWEICWHSSHCWNHQTYVCELHRENFSGDDVYITIRLITPSMWPPQQPAVGPHSYVGCYWFWSRMRVIWGELHSLIHAPISIMGLELNIFWKNASHGTYILSFSRVYSISCRLLCHSLCPKQCPVSGVWSSLQAIHMSSWSKISV